MWGGKLRLASGEISDDETVASIYTRFQSALKEPKTRSAWDISMSRFTHRGQTVKNSNMKLKKLHLKK